MINLVIFTYNFQQIKEDCQTAISTLPWVTSVNVTVLKKKPSTVSGTGSTLQHTAHFIAVSSCKVSQYHLYIFLHYITLFGLHYTH